MNTAILPSDVTPLKGLIHQASIVSWAAILAGAAMAVALSLLLFFLGIGLGFSVVSPWYTKGISAMDFGISAILWLTLTQLVASGFGGYITARLRTWGIAANKEDVYFRDSAHGFITWAIASLTAALLFTSVMSSIMGGGMLAGAAIVSSEALGNAIPTRAEPLRPDEDKTLYFIDSLFRPLPTMNTPAMQRNSNKDPAGAPSTGNEHSSDEVSRIFMNTLMSGPIPQEDVNYVAQLVAQQTGLSKEEAAKRVRDTYARLQTQLNDAQTKALKAADKARQASVYAALWLFISLLASALFASCTALYGGRHRDKQSARHPS